MAEVGGEQNGTAPDALLIDVEGDQIVTSAADAPDTTAQAEDSAADLQAALPGTVETEEEADDAEVGEVSGDTAETRSRKRRNRRNNKGRREPRNGEAQDTPAPIANAAVAEPETVAADSSRSGSRCCGGGGGTH